MPILPCYQILSYYIIILYQNLYTLYVNQSFLASYIILMQRIYLSLAAVTVDTNEENK